METENKFLIDEIKRKIKSTVHPCYENVSGTELYVRCPNCGDSKKSKLSAHFYIQMKPPFVCYCQKCRYSGILNSAMLEKLQIYDSNIIDNINEVNKDSAYNKYKNYTYKTKSQFKIDYIEQETDATKKALEYFNNRFGVNETLETVNKFNIICDPIQFFKYLYDKHNIQLTYNPKFDYYNSIGFLSTDRKYMISRYIGNDENIIRYTNTAISNDEDRSRIYNIKTKVDIMSPSITLVITEGIFDAIGIYYKEYSESENIIIAAACGKSFEQVIMSFIKRGFLNLNIKIYSDADVDISFYTKMKKQNKIISTLPIEVYYNTLEKDCGVPKDRILLTKTKI